MEDYEEEAIINCEILKPLFETLRSHTREYSRRFWGFYDGTDKYFGLQPKIWYINRRVSIHIDNSLIITRHDRLYFEVDLSDVNCYEKTVDWLSIRMPTILKSWKINERMGV